MADFDWVGFDPAKHRRALAPKGRYRFCVLETNLEDGKQPGSRALVLKLSLEGGLTVFSRIRIKHPDKTVQKIGLLELSKLCDSTRVEKLKGHHDFLAKRGCVEIDHYTGKDGTVYERFKYLPYAEAVKLNKSAPIPQVQPTPNPLEDLMDANGLSKASKSCKANKTKSRGQEEPLETEDEEDAPLLPKKRKVEEEEEDAPPPPKKRKAAYEEDAPPSKKRKVEANEEDEDMEPDEPVFPSRPAVKLTPKAKPKWRPEADHTDDGEE